ncbi:unnamed protein product, partial [Dicrocoelium dendriticum]
MLQFEFLFLELGHFGNNRVGPHLMPLSCVCADGDFQIQLVSRYYNHSLSFNAITGSAYCFKRAGYPQTKSRELLRPQHQTNGSRTLRSHSQLLSCTWFPQVITACRVEADLFWLMLTTTFLFQMRT